MKLVRTRISLRRTASMEIGPLAFFLVEVLRVLRRVSGFGGQQRSGFPAKEFREQATSKLPTVGKAVCSYRCPRVEGAGSSGGATDDGRCPIVGVANTEFQSHLTAALCEQRDSKRSNLFYREGVSLRSCSSGLLRRWFRDSWGRGSGVDV